MRSILTILLLLPMMVQAGRVREVRSFWSEKDWTMHWVTAEEVGSSGIRYTEWRNYGAYSPAERVQFWTNYTWNASNGVINITNSTFGTLHGGDTVFVPFKSGGYYSFSFTGLGTASEGRHIVLYWQPGAEMSVDTTSARFANTMGNDNWVKVYGWTQRYSVDVAFNNYQSGGYSHRIIFDSCTFIHTNGFFPSQDPTGSGANFTGGDDTTNCQYAWTWNKCKWDSIVGNNKGQTALWIGGIHQNQAWVRTTIKYCYFGHYRSPNSPESGGPATYIAASNVWGLYIYHNQFEDLGMDMVSPVGHAAQILPNMCYFEIYNNYFAERNFGNCCRNSGCGSLYGNTLLATWSAGYDGRSRMYNNISYNSRKYPMLETRSNPTDASTLGYAQYRTGPYFYNNTGYKQGLGVCCSPYVPFYDNYGTDSIFMKNCALIGPTDTNWTAAGIGATHEGYNRMINNGVVFSGYYDTAGSVFMEYARFAGMDSTTFSPTYGSGAMYNHGVSVPSWLTTDYYDNPRSVGGAVDVGAVEALVPVSTNQRIQYKYRKNISRKI